VKQAIELLPAVIVACVVLLITRYGVSVVRRVVRAVSHRLFNSLSLQLLLVQIASVSTWVLGVLIACTLVFPSLRLGDIIALLGLSSVAVGFAFQDIFKNFLAGILLLLNEPFRLGDQIIVNGYEGTVEVINIRSTEIRTYQNEQVVIPNSLGITNSVQVLTHFSSRRTDLPIGLAYDTPLAAARSILLEALAPIEGILAEPAAEVDVVGFGDSSIEFVVRYWTLPQIAHVRRTRSRVIVALKQACDRAKLTIPYPVRTLYWAEKLPDNDAFSSPPTLE
jgi:small-conductance mechanosensitive channel